MAFRQQRREENKYPHFTHNPFSVTVDGIKVTCDETGKMVLETKDESGNDLVIETTARLFVRVSKILFNTRDVEYKDEPYKESEDD